MPKRIEDIIFEHGYYITKPKGSSMFPMIKPGSGEVCIVKADSVLKNDVILYKRKNGKYVLHRVLKIIDDEFVCCGDNQWEPEYGVTRDMIIGKLDSWYSGDKKRTVKDKDYLRYVKFWCKSLALRRFLLFIMSLKWRIKELCYKIYKKFFKKGN